MFTSGKKETKLETNIFPPYIPQFFSFYTRGQSRLPPRPICIPPHLLGGYPSPSCPSSVHPLGSGARTTAKLSFILFSSHVFEFLVPPTKTHMLGTNPSPFLPILTPQSIRLDRENKKSSPNFAISFCSIMLIVWLIKKALLAAKDQAKIHRCHCDTL